MIQLDTIVLIDILRGRQAALAYVADVEDQVGISVLTVSELTWVWGPVKRRRWTHSSPPPQPRTRLGLPRTI